MKIVDSMGVTQDALARQVERINDEVKRLETKEKSKHEYERIEYLNYQLDGLVKLINMNYKIEFDERENINSLDLHLIVNGVLKVRFCKYGTKDDCTKFVLWPHFEHQGSLCYFQSKLETPNKVKVTNATKAKIDRWVEYSKKYIQEVQQYEAEIKANRLKGLAVIENLKQLENVKCVEIDDYKGELNKAYFDSENFQLTCEFDVLGKLKTGLRLKCRSSCEIELFNKLAEGGF